MLDSTTGEMKLLSTMHNESILGLAYVGWCVVPGHAETCYVVFLYAYDFTKEAPQPQTWLRVFQQQGEPHMPLEALKFVADNLPKLCERAKHPKTD